MTPQQPAPDRHREVTQEREVRLTAQRLLRDHLCPDRDDTGQPANPRYWGKLDLNLHGATLLNLDLAGIDVGYAGFGNATFAGDASFLDATFSGDAIFVEATFAGDAFFDGATFDWDAYFIDAIFDGQVAINGTTFAGEAFFFGATFAVKPSYHLATFKNGGPR